MASFPLILTPSRSGFVQRWMRVGETLPAGSYRICVARGLMRASGMHTCPHTSYSLNKQHYPPRRERRKREKPETGLCRDLHQSSLHLPEGSGGGRRVRCQRCGLAGWKGHSGDVVSVIIRQHYVAVCILLLVYHMLYFVIVGFLQAQFLRSYCGAIIMLVISRKSKF